MHGTFPSQEIARLVKEGAISSSAGIAPEQVQPSSLDLTLSVEAYSMTGSLLPLGGEKVRDLIERFARYPELDLAGEPVRDRRIRFRGFRHLPVRLAP